MARLKTGSRQNRQQASKQQASRQQASRTATEISEAAATEHRRKQPAMRATGT